MRPLHVLTASLVLASGCNAILGNEEHPFHEPNAGGASGSAGKASGGSTSGHGGAGVANAGGSSNAATAGSNAAGDEAGAGLGGMGAEGASAPVGGSSLGGSGARGGSAGRVSNAGRGGDGGASGEAGNGGAGESGSSGTTAGGTSGAGSGGTAGTSGGAANAGASAGGTTGGGAGTSGLCDLTCFDGPASAAGHGVCKSGHYSCDGQNSCTGETLPSVELCGGVNDASDENCDSTVGCAGGVQTATLSLGGVASGRMRIKRDAQGNEYWLGDYYQPLQIGSTELAGGGEQGDIFYAKVSPTGTPIWVKSIAGLGWQYASDLVVHANGEFTIAGLYSTTTDEDFAIGGTSLSTPNVGSGYGFLARFDGNGDPIWVDDLEGSYSSDPRNLGIAASPDGGVYVWTVSGNSLGIKHNGSVSGASINVGDVSGRTYYQYLLQVGADGAVGRTFAGAWSQSYMALSGLAVTPDNTVYVLGFHQGNDFDFGNAGRNQVGTGGYLLKLDGPTSSKGFVAQWTAAISVRPTELALDAAGNIYVTAGNTFTKFTSAGGAEWSKTFGAFGAAGVTTDVAGYVSVAGTCAGSVDFNAGGPSGGLTSSGSDFCLAKFLPDGTFLWQNHVGDASVQTAEAITADELGYLHVLGTVQGTFDPANGKKLDAGSNTGLLHAVVFP